MALSSSTKLEVSPARRGSHIALQRAALRKRVPGARGHYEDVVRGSRGIDRGRSTLTVVVVGQALLTDAVWVTTNLVRIRRFG